MRILITGASGFLGRKLFTAFTHSGDEVVGTYFTHFYPDLQNLDINDTVAVNDLFSRERPELVIHVAGIGRPDRLKDNLNLAYKVNVEGTRNVVNVCRNNNVLLVYFSSVFVFDGGKQGPYTEDDETNPINTYGKTKVKAENLVREVPNSIIFRTDMMYGYNGRKMNNGFFGVIAKEPSLLNLNAENVRQPLFVDDIEPAIKILLKNKLFGTFNLSCNEYITQYDLGRKLEKIVRESSLIYPNHQVDKARPKNVLLDTTKVKNLGITFTSIEESIGIIDKQIKQK